MVVHYGMNLGEFFSKIFYPDASKGMSGGGIGKFFGVNIFPVDTLVSSTSSQVEFFSFDDPRLFTGSAITL